MIRSKTLICGILACGAASGYANEASQNENAALESYEMDFRSEIAGKYSDYDEEAAMQQQRGSSGTQRGGETRGKEHGKEHGKGGKGGKGGGQAGGGTAAPAPAPKSPPPPPPPPPPPAPNAPGGKAPPLKAPGGSNPIQLNPP